MASAYVLVVDDEPDIGSLLKEILEDEGYEVDVAENGQAAREARRARRPDLILLDIWMPDVDGITLLKEWSEEEATPTPVIVMSGHGTVDTAVEATRLGAYDFIEKPLSLGKLLVTIKRALEAYYLQQENQGLRRQAQPVVDPVGRSPVMETLREKTRRVAQHETPVLIRGESGSGKGVVARYLHAQSPRLSGPFVEVGVASLLGDNPTAELFGSEEHGKVHFGLVEQANNGTLFLDDIADMDPITQARLVGALESGSYLRVGGSDPVSVNVRVVAATQHELEERIPTGRFRRDLYYKLNVVPIDVPALREHLEDIPDLVSFYIGYFVDQDNLPYRPFNVAAQNRLRQYHWPGNVRELQNMIQRLLIVGRGDEIGVEEVETALGAAQSAAAVPAGIDFRLPLRQAREQFERVYFEHLLRDFEGSVVKVAQHAGIERTHLYRKLRALDIDPKTIMGKQ